MDVHEELEIAALDAVTNNDSLSAPPTPVPELQTLPKFQTTVLPSNGQVKKNSFCIFLIFDPLLRLRLPQLLHGSEKVDLTCT